MDHFCQDTTLDVLEAEAQCLPSGAGGLVLLPYWNSVLNPYWDPAASGLVMGWRGHHRRGHFFRAILEGIAFELRLHFEGISAELGREIERVVVTGGGSKSDLWCQILADVTATKVQRTTATQATALGAGMIAATGLNLFPNLTAATREMGTAVQSEFTPRLDQVKTYNRIYQEVYRNLYPAVQALMDWLR
jgi:xylulokinase